MDVSEDIHRHLHATPMHSSRVYQFEVDSYATVNMHPLMYSANQSYSRRPSCVVVCIHMY